LSENVQNRIKVINGDQTYIKTDQKSDRHISELVGALTDPIIVMPGGWGDTLPVWIKEAVTIERLISNMKQLKGEIITATDAEAVAYLYTASLEAPLDGDWVEIYLYLASKVIGQHRKTGIPADIKVESINDYQQSELSRFKRWIYETRVRARKEKDKSERRERTEKEKQEKEVLQPRMFDF
jgi:hypothetical protein